uniref:Decapping nuclease n=1 Tax=Hippocampus comes TaxID=109280 RepID=A0A3Q2YND5_HIPCM
SLFGKGKRPSQETELSRQRRKEPYARCSPPFKERVEEGSFSLDTERRFHHDKSQMRYIVEPDETPNFDLRNGYSDRYIKRDENVRKNLEHILQWILANKSKLMFKLLKWWAQSFLLGVPRIVAGFKNDDGLVVSVRTYRTAEIPQLVQYLGWKPEVCMNFCSDFLSFVKRVVIEDDPHVVYLFSRKALSDVTFTVHRNSSYSFLPDWYVTKMKPLKSSPKAKFDLLSCFQ